ncbi:unnamed protein product [Lepeophtheirus salmonis]|uniref:(salmon louse) hypothetical protein n=1 Tax=Lepeophtheirus salmonis TaxID=72036 RepID=A0A7R8D6J6_LEPSM|nr:unnamed protein product [Lepeophtheirus salmonis]CAF3018166.1 unnamed protein product [Lepeophtheirus salmonis]
MGRGKDLLDFLVRMETPNIPESSDGEELDWVWEMGGEEFLEWLLCNVHPETHLLRKNEANYREGAGPCLSDCVLEKALDALPDERSVEDVREEVDTLERELSSLEDFEKEMRECSKSVGRQESALASRASLIKSKLIQEQEREDIPLMEASNQYTQQLDLLIRELHSISELTSFKDPKKILISEFNIESITKEDDKFSKLVDEFIDKQFKVGIQARDLSENICYDLVVGRSEAEFEELVAEISRLRLGFKDEEKRKTLSSARLQGEKEAFQYLTTYSFKNDLNKEPSGLMVSSQQLYNIITDEIKVELISASQKSLSPLLDEIAALHCRQILNLDCQIKLYRQKYTLDRHNVLKEILLEQFSRQEMLLILLRNEFQGFKRIGNEVSSIQDHHRMKYSQLTKTKETIKSIKDELSGIVTTTVVNPHNDITLASLGNILNSTTPSVPLTYNKLLSSFTDFISSRKNNMMECERHSQQNIILYNRSLSGLKSLYEDLGSGSKLFFAIN